MSKNLKLFKIYFTTLNSSLGIKICHFYFFKKIQMPWAHVQLCYFGLFASLILKVK